MKGLTMPAKVHRVRSECEMPTEDDLDYMCAAMQRHTEGFDVWWKQFVAEASGRDCIAAIISIWEAGRAKAHSHSPPNPDPSFPLGENPCPTK